METVERGDGYEILRAEDGLMAIQAESVPAHVFSEVLLHHGEDDWVMDPGLAHKMGMFAVIGDPNTISIRQAHMHRQAQADRPEKSADIHERLGFWFRHGDVGASSRAVAEALDFSTGARKEGPSLNHPYDAGDFLRCSKLLTLLPEARQAITDVLAPRSEHWGRLDENWEEISAVLETEMQGPDARAPETNALIRKVLEPRDLQERTAMRARS